MTDMDIKQLSSSDLSDFIALLRIFEVEFEWVNYKIPANDYLQQLLSSDNFLVFVVKSEGKLVGGLSAHILPSYEVDKSAAYIYDVAIAKAYQRKGFGAFLLAHFKDYCKQRGFFEMFVQADAADTHAINFYKKTNISSEMQAVHYAYVFDK